MKVHPLIASVILAGIASLQIWTVRSVSDLQIKVARIDQELQDKLASARVPIGTPVVELHDAVPATVSFPVAHGASLLVQTPK